MHQTDWLNRQNLYCGDSVAIVDAARDAQITYAELHRDALQLSGWLAAQGVGRGDRVAVLAGNRYEFIPLFFAVQRLGAILVPLNFRLAQPELEHIVQDASPVLLLADEEFTVVAQRLGKVTDTKTQPLQLYTHDTPADSASEFSDPSLILYTSGTTGMPKGVLITNEMIFWNSVNTGLRLNLTSADGYVSFLPFFHTGAWNVLTFPLLHRGGTVILTPKFDAKDVLMLSSQFKATILFGVPTTMSSMAQCSAFAQSDLTSVRYALVGGEAMPEKLIDTWHDRGIPIRQGYGLTEFGPNVFSLAAEDAKRKRGSIGFPNFYVDVRLVDALGAEVKGAGVGEAWFAGPVATPGYWNNPEQTKKNRSPDGWIKSGDVLRRDEDGYYYVVGRVKEMYISGGENVYPAEVERVLLAHPEIVEAAVIGVPDAKWGEVGKAFVASRDRQLSAEELTTYCRQHLAGYKTPRHFVYVPELPKLANGKVAKKHLSTAVGEI